MAFKGSSKKPPIAFMPSKFSTYDPDEGSPWNMAAFRDLTALPDFAVISSKIVNAGTVDNGSMPVNPTTIAGWAKIQIGGVPSWIPYYR